MYHFRKLGFTVQMTLISIVFYVKRLTRKKILEISTNHNIRTALYDDQDKINYKLFSLNSRAHIRIDKNK